MTTAPHVTAYLARLDEHVAALPDDGARRLFLAREADKWLDRYEAWAARVDRGALTDPNVHAADFHETLGEIARRVARWRK